jgi:glycosyltransferase involved in cell wall biosynthesis
MSAAAPPRQAGHPGRAGVSVTVITRNEQARIRECLESAAWADEVVVVDAESTDATVAIARDFTSRVVVRPWPGFAAQKNFALGQATQPWVLSLDADERISPELREEILAVLAQDGPLDGYEMPRRNLFLGRWIRHGMWYPDYQLRLFRRERASFPPVEVHESPRVDGRVGRLRHALVHRSYEGIGDFVERADRYSTLAARDLVAGGGTPSTADLLLRPLGRFLAMYLWHRGFLDGGPGLLLAGLYSYYVFLRTAKAWVLARQAGA